MLPLQLGPGDAALHRPAGRGGRLPCLNLVVSFPGTFGSLELLLQAFRGTLILKDLLPRSPLETLEMVWGVVCLGGAQLVG